MVVHELHNYATFDVRTSLCNQVLNNTSDVSDDDVLTWTALAKGIKQTASDDSLKYMAIDFSCGDIYCDLYAVHDKREIKTPS